MEDLILDISFERVLSKSVTSDTDDVMVELTEGTDGGVFSSEMYVGGTMPLRPSTYVYPI